MAKDNKGKIEELDLDMNLDDIADLPGFMTPPTGGYKVMQLSSERKEVGDHAAMEIKFKLLEIVELNEDNLNENEAPPKVGDEFSMLFMLDNEFGIGAMKAYLKPIAERAKTTSVKDTLKAGDNMELLMILHRKHDKNKDQDFTKIKQVALI